MSRGVLRTPWIFEALLPSALWGATPRGRGEVFLTFDDGPDPAATPPLLDLLASEGITAGFFLTGEKLAASPEVTERIHAQGHRIGYHGLSHSPWSRLKGEALRREMDPARLSPPLPGWTTRSPRLLRPPHGRIGPAALREARRLGARLVFWRLMIGDWIEGKTAAVLESDLLAHTRPGDIIVLHDGGPCGVLLPDVLSRVLPAWRGVGIEVGSFSALAGAAP